MQGGDLLHRDLITEDLSSFFLTSLSAFNSTLTTPSSLAHLYLTQQQQLASPSAHATPPPQPLQHTVVGGDTWAGLAVRYGVSIADIKRANGQFSDLLLPGTQLGIPLQQTPHFPATEATMHMAFSPTTTTQITDAAAMFEYGSPPGSAPYGYTQASHEQYYFYLQQQQQLQDPFTSSSSFLPSSTSTFRQAEASAAMASALYPIDSITTPSSPPSQAAAFDPFHLHCSPSPPRSSPQRSPAACASPSSARRQVSASPLYAAHDHSTTSTTTTTSNNKNRGSSSIRAKQPMQPPASLKTAPAGKSGQRSSAAARQHARASKEYSAVDIASFHRHAVSHEDTLQGIALRYGVAPADVKRLNRMATDEVYAYSEVIVPIDRELAARLPPPKAIDPDRAHRFQLAAFRKRTATDETEANYYIKLAEGDFKEALRLWHSDQQWEDEHRGPDDPLPQSLRNSPLVSIPSPSFAPRLSRHC